MVEKKLACCYTRFSTDQQNQSSTIGQLRAIRKYCKDNGIELIDTYIDEAQSGTTMNRVNFQRMINDSYHALWKYIVVYNMSRLSRSVKDMLLLKEDFKKRGITILSVIEKQDETPEGDFFNLITYGLNELFVKQFRRDSWRGLLVNANECKAQGGIPPYGYAIGKDKKYIIDEQEAEVVKIIFKRIIEGYSYREIAKELNEKGITHRGKPFRPFFTDILNNEKYMGIYVWNKRERKNKDGRRNDHKYKNDSEIIRIEGGMPLIIEKEIFNQVQEILKSRKKKRTWNIKKTKYLLTGLIRCKKCGNVYSGGHAFSGRNKTLRYFYKCNKQKTDSNKCEMKDINMLYLDEYVKGLVKNVILKIDNSKCFKEFFNKIIRMTNSKIENRIKELESKNNLINNELEKKINELTQTEEYNYVSLSNEISKLTAEKEENEKKILVLLKEYSQPQKITINEIETKIRELAKMYKLEDGEKEVIHALIEEIIMDKSKILIKINFNKIINEANYNNNLIINYVESRDSIAQKSKFKNQDISINKLITHFIEKINEA